MFERLKTRRLTVPVVAAALAALGVGGTALAQSDGTPAKAPTSPPSVQAPERSAPENTATDRDNIQNENGKDDATEASDRAEGPEKAEQPGQESREVANDDGPGGHADEPGNPNADHQFQGKQ